MEERLIEIFVQIDDFCNVYEPRLRLQLKALGFRARFRKDVLALSELMTIAVLYQQSQMRNFKSFYFTSLSLNLKEYFPRLPSYQRLVALLSTIAIPLDLFLSTQAKKSRGIAFIDSTILRACHFQRRHRNKVLRGIAATAKSTIGWFFGLKLHLLVSDQGELLAYKITPGNCDDRVPVMSMAKGMHGLLIGDKGYISDDLEFSLAKSGIKLVTKTKANMGYERVLTSFEKKCLRARGLIETINDQLKNIFHIEHTRYRSIRSFFVNVLSGLAAFTFKKKKPSMA